MIYWYEEIHWEIDMGLYINKNNKNRKLKISTFLSSPRVAIKHWLYDTFIMKQVRLSVKTLKHGDLYSICATMLPKTHANGET